MATAIHIGVGSNDVRTVSCKR